MHRAERGRHPREPSPSSNGSAEDIKLLRPREWQRTYTLAELPGRLTNYMNYTPNIIHAFASCLDGDEYRLLDYVIRWTYGGVKKGKRVPEDEDLPTKARPVFVETNARTLSAYINRSADVVRDRLHKLHTKGILCVGYQAAPSGDGYAGFSIGLGPELVKAINTGILPHKLLVAAERERKALSENRRARADGTYRKKVAKAHQHRRDRLSAGID